MAVNLDGTPVAGGYGMQGYSRAADGHNESSVHWSGLVQSSSASQSLTITVKREAQAGATTVQSGKEFSIYVEKIDTSTGVLYARGNNLLSGTDWNPASAQAVRWETEDIKDATMYTHATSGGTEHQVTVNEGGDYLLVYNDAMASSGTRVNNKITVEVNGTPRAGAETKCHYLKRRWTQ